MISVIGLGKLGLPISVQFASRGFRVTGIDKDRDLVEQINAGLPAIYQEEYLSEKLQRVRESGTFSASTEIDKSLKISDVIVVVVPLKITSYGEPDFSTLDYVVEKVGLNLKQGSLVSIETTLPIGTTRERIAPQLEKLSSLKVGLDFYLVYSPERVLTGRIFSDLRKYPKLVGGVTDACTEKGVEFYSRVLEFEPREDLLKPNGVWAMTSSEAAEFSKLAETTYRDVNIALANEFALHAEKINVSISEVIEACNSQQYSNIHSPGIAVGGHCIPVYPNLYLWKRESAEMVRLARKINESMPEISVKRLEELFGSLRSKTVVVFGVSYRGGVKETYLSGVFAIVESLLNREATVLVHDPLYSDNELRSLGLTPYHFGMNLDFAIIHTNHSEYRKLLECSLPGLRAILDGRGILEKNSKKLNVVTIGEPKS